MAKGSAFEREISKKLTIWLTGKEKPFFFFGGCLRVVD